MTLLERLRDTDKIDDFARIEAAHEIEWLRAVLRHIAKYRHNHPDIIRAYAKLHLEDSDRRILREFSTQK
jgi:hypothetical protein